MRTRVLIVDDEQTITQTLGKILSISGYEPLCAGNAVEAIEAMESFLPHIVLSDVFMPGMNGIELAKTLRGTHPNCSILLFSGNAATQELLESASDEGHYFPIVAKPIHPRELLAILSELTGAGKSVMKQAAGI